MIILCDLRQTKLKHNVHRFVCDSPVTADSIEVIKTEGEPLEVCEVFVEGTLSEHPVPTEEVKRRQSKSVPDYELVYFALPAFFELWTYLMSL